MFSSGMMKVERGGMMNVGSQSVEFVEGEMAMTMMPGS